MEERTDLSSYLSPAQHNLRNFLCGTIAKRAWAIRTASLTVHSAKVQNSSFPTHRAYRAISCILTLDGAPWRIFFFRDYKGRVNNSNWKQKNNWTPKTTYNKNANKGGSDIRTVKSFNCNEMGHYANKCPSPKQSIMSAAQQVRFKPTYLRKPAIRTAATRIKMP